jgi:acyl carrier protein
VDQTQVESAVIELLIELQSLAGEETAPITQTTRPLADLAFFDSLLGLELTVSLEERLGIEIDEQTVFADGDTREPLSVAQIAEMISERYAGATA